MHGLLQKRKLMDCITADGVTRTEQNNRDGKKKENKCKIEGGQEENFNMFYIQNKTKVLAQAISIWPRTALGKDKDQQADVCWIMRKKVCYSKAFFLIHIL